MREQKIILLGGFNGKNFGGTAYRECDRVYSIKAISPTLTNFGGVVTASRTLLRGNKLKNNKIIDYGTLTDVSGLKWKNPQRRRVYSIQGICPTIYNYGGRKLTAFYYYKEGTR